MRTCSWEWSDLSGGGETPVCFWICYAYTGASGKLAGYTAIGDAWQIDGSGTGGNDMFTGGAGSGDPEAAWAGHDAWVTFVGDAHFMYDNAVGGRDTMTAGANTASFLIGDAVVASSAGLVQGGADVLTGGASTTGWAVNRLYGDFQSQDGQVIGGNDRLVGGNSSSNSRGEGVACANILAGDSQYMTGGHGGNDTIVGGNASARGGGEVVVGNTLYGDATFAHGAACGNDSIVGGNSSGAGSEVANIIFGDARSSDSPGMVFGNDTVRGGNSSNGGSVYNSLVGDASVMTDGVGGNDLLVAGGAGSINDMRGDAEQMSSTTRGGNDTLVGGAGTDEMWGDGGQVDGQTGADLFVFKGSSGQDTIHDFEVAKDVIDLSAMHRWYGSFDAFVAQGRAQDDGNGNTILHLDIANPSGNINTVTLTGVHADSLTAGDFVI